MEGMGTEAFAMVPYAGQLPNQVPWRRSSGPLRRTAKRETHNSSRAPSHYGEAGAARPSSAEAFLCAVESEMVVSREMMRECPLTDIRLWPVCCKWGIYGVNISCKTARTAARVPGAIRPSRLLSRSLSTVRSWSIATNPARSRKRQRTRQG